MSGVFSNANRDVQGATSRSMLPTSKLRRPAVSRIAKKNSLEEGKEVSGGSRPAAPKAGIKPRNPSLSRVTKKNVRRSMGKMKVSFNPAAGKKRMTAGKSTIKLETSGPPPIRAPLKQKRNAENIKPAGPSMAKKAKRSAWDYKGQLEDMKEEFQQQKEALGEEKRKAGQMDDVLRRLEALESEKQVIQVQNTDLSGDLQEKDRQIAALKSDVVRMADEHERAMKRSSEEHDREIRKLRVDLEDARGDLRKVRQERDELDVQLRSANRLIAEQGEKLSTTSTQLKELKENCQNLEGLNEGYQKTIEKQDEDLKKQNLDRKKLLNEVQELKGNIRVFCRVRPAINDEEAPNHINYEGQAEKSLNVYNHEKECKYSFDKVFGPQATQGQVYEELDQLVQSSLDGFNVCVFAYGQTGSGKTYTMEGPDDMTEETCGVIPRAMKQIFIKCQDQKKLGWEYELHVEHVEIYCEALQDLLRNGSNTEKLEIRTKNPKGQTLISVPNLSTHRVEKYADVMKLLTLSKRRRATAATTANDHSSRSHSVFMLRIKAVNEATGQETESSLNLIDLAGSERCGDNGATGQRLKEGKKINSSLTALSCVIMALANKDSHVPYRNSKLTHLLTNSLGGNSKTLMVVNINPSPSATGETVNTLRFATTVNQCNIGTAQKAVKF